MSDAPNSSTVPVEASPPKRSMARLAGAIGAFALVLASLGALFAIRALSTLNGQVQAAASLAAVFGALVGASIAGWIVAAEPRSDGRAIVLGFPAWAQPLAVVTHGVGVALLASTVDHDDAWLTGGLVTGWATSWALLAGVAMASSGRLTRVASETRGLVRVAVGLAGSWLVLGGSFVLACILVALAGADAHYNLDLAFGMPAQGALSAWIESVRALATSEGLSVVVAAASVAVLVGATLQLGSLVASFFLIPSVVRERFWRAVDVVATTAFVFALWTLPFVPGDDDEDVTLPAIALGITAVFVTRMAVCALPLLLARLELVSFELGVASRMLRARKSGFLTAIGVLSVLAVSFSSCTLATTLSVMGGFRADLQQKILGNHAHVVVDRAYGTFDDWQATLERVRATPDVTGATPYVAGEVMLTSAIEAPSGAELRGIDPTTLGDATDLPNNMRFGSLSYLSHPEVLLDLPPDQMSGSLLEPATRHDAPTVEDLPPLPDDESQAPAGLIQEIDRALAALPTTPSSSSSDAGLPTEPPADREARREALAHEIDALLGLEPVDPSATPAETTDPFAALQLDTHERAPRDVLPGLVVGQELARSLRLHVGDEVTVVSPNGDLGPTGPVPRTRAFRIAGIFYTGMFEYDMQMAYTDLATAQSFLRAGEGITGIEARVSDWTRADEVAREVHGTIGRDDLRVQSWREVNRNLFGALELEKLAMFITLGIAILVASFCIFAALVLMVQEKGREVGILKAMGADDASIVRVFLFQGLFVGLFGASSGLGLGYLVCFAAEHFKFIRMNPEVYYIDRLPVNVDGLEFSLVGVASVLVCVLATVYPAILGSRLRPVDALRNA